MPNEDLMDIYSDPNKTFYMEKFAELIVKECITRMMRVGGDESFYSNYVMTYLDCIEDIKQHFGVKL